MFLPSELLRQYQDFGGLYDRETLKWIEIQDVVLCAACGPPGGGRNPTSARLLRHFAIFAIPPPSEYSLKHIFKSILNGYLAEFNQNIRTAGDTIIDAAVEIYSRMSAELLPTPTKSHYVFNLRDLSKCIQGILQVRHVDAKRWSLRESRSSRSNPRVSLIGMDWCACSSTRRCVSFTIV